MSNIIVNRTTNSAADLLPPAAGPASSSTAAAVPYTPPSRNTMLFYTWKIHQWIVLVLVFVVPLMISVLIPPVCREFRLEDFSINYSFTEKEMFPDWSLGFVVVLPIVLVYYPTIYYWKGTSKNKAKELNAWALTHLMGVGLALGMINATKVMGGRLRPDFVARLRREGLVAATPIYPPVFNAGFGYDSVCERKWLMSNSITHDGHLSFPSGHSGTAFSAMLPLCLFLMSRLRPFYYESLLRFVISLSPLILAWVVALSRTIDYRHNYSDILAGGIIGVICGCITLVIHFTYIPSLGVWALKVPTCEYDEYVVGRRLRQAARAERARTAATTCDAGSEGGARAASGDDGNSILVDRPTNSTLVGFGAGASPTTIVSSPNTVSMAGRGGNAAAAVGSFAVPMGADDDSDPEHYHYVTARSQDAYFRVAGGSVQGQRGGQQGSNYFRANSAENRMLQN